MTVLTKVAVLLGLAASTAWGVPTTTTPRGGGDEDGYSLLPRQSNSNASGACGVISQSATRQLQANPRAVPRFAATDAMACLASVPNKPAEATKLVQSLKAFVSWQSTLSYLKDPPASYGLPAVDIMGSLDAIAANVTAGSYQSEYDFQKDMILLIASAHDGHFGYRPDIFKTFTFRNDLLADMVSVSVDGKQVPKLYNYGKLFFFFFQVTPSFGLC